MAILNFVLGNNMAGKSSSIRNLNPDTTRIIQGLRRDVPKSSSGKLFTKGVVNSVKQLSDVVKKISEKNPEVKTIVLDDFHYIFGGGFARNIKAKGFGKYDDFFLDYYTLFETLINLREDLFVHILWHVEPIKSGDKIIKYEPIYVGSAIKKYNNPLGMGNLVLFAKSEYNEEGNPDFFFHTQSYQDENGIEYPARSMEGMFEENRIPNDLALVEEKYKNYYEIK